MNSGQRIIKYVAIAFAAFLSITIIGGIGSAVIGLAGGFSSGKTINFEDTFDNVKSIKVESSTAKISIVEGDSFEVTGEDVSDSMKAYVENNVLIVKDTDKGLFSVLDGGADGRITITVPEDFVAELTRIDTGTGKVNLEYLNTKKLEIAAGTGNVTGSYINASQVTIEGGVANIRLNNVAFNDTTIDGGVGNIEIQGILTGRTNLDCGVGSVNLSIVGDYDDYNIEVEAGLGSIRINGEKVSEINKSVIGAINDLNVEGGVGSINIDIQE